jgi:cell wall hydrolase/autolysin|nr:MAG TPA: Cell wall hydrolase autolysin [Caudoviricetes sp.]
MAKAILNIGHGGIQKDPGAIGNGFKEHYWNDDFVNNYIVPECKKQGLNYEIVYQDYYSKLPRKINSVTEKGDIVLSFHLNAFNPESNGVEMLFWHNSEKSKKLASYFQNANLEATHLRDRAILPRQLNDRGAYLLKNTIAPCIIVESGFVTNLHDMEVLQQNKSNLAKNYVAAAKKYLEEMN